MTVWVLLKWFRLTVGESTHRLSSCTIWYMISLIANQSATISPSQTTAARDTANSSESSTKIWSSNSKRQCRKCAKVQIKSPIYLLSPTPETILYHCYVLHLTFLLNDWLYSVISIHWMYCLIIFIYWQVLNYLTHCDTNVIHTRRCISF